MFSLLSVVRRKYTVIFSMYISVLILQDIMLCGGSDAAIIPIGLGGFVACRALSQRNNDPTKDSRPWDSERDGFVMGEGSGVLLLEELEHAKQRGANIYAEFLGGSFTCDAYHMTEPHPEAYTTVEDEVLGGQEKEDEERLNPENDSLFPFNEATIITFLPYFVG
ncbi:3-oxoacyl-[acyl-carrier-protein] synthase II, chloroplastic-like isoform X2 [Asparagus officinalis]|uniref:3-oxoacyl-[acyl-carrier-protein] synthase II, chloroplastic-like isoform X2 n=1 Tax=Asparagus officinalis TaxID=4686 RepID=UPI00098E5D27|nr:3-oxoacyl-[acyl-carrier-protein] synthase II, chloroplastic-like isoform X2 [Asparagus officinalis]